MPTVLENLTYLKNLIASVPDKQLDLSKFKQDAPDADEPEISCGTLYCVAGFAASAPYFQVQGMELVLLPADDQDKEPFWIVKHVNGSPFECEWADELFGPNAFDRLFAEHGGGTFDNRIFNDMVEGETLSDKKLALERIAMQIERMSK